MSRSRSIENNITRKDSSSMSENRFVLNSVSGLNCFHGYQGNRMQQLALHYCLEPSLRNQVYFSISYESTCRTWGIKQGCYIKVWICRGWLLKQVYASTVKTVRYWPLYKPHLSGKQIVIIYEIDSGSDTFRDNKRNSDLQQWLVADYYKYWLFREPFSWPRDFS